MILKEKMDLLIKTNLANTLLQNRLQIHQSDMSQCAAAKEKKYYCVLGFNKKCSDSPC
jgi:tRNA1(Val) A37 N6-methylase TrmN6